MATAANKKQSESKKKVELNLDSIPYYKVKITCACGAEFDAGSTLESLRVDICSKCHPFFTGEQRILDSEGRVEKFRKKYNISEKK